jgi:dipeptidyl aminopeptidase/acylaminoacyl peptidase
VAVAAEGDHEQRGSNGALWEMLIGPLGERDYAAASNVPLAANLKGKLLLAHGEMDENASLSLTMKLVDALVKANKPFDLLILPGETHFMIIDSPYFIHRKWDYFVRNLLQAEPPVRP